MLDALAVLLGGLTREFALFAAIGFLVGGLDDLAIDAIWIVRTAWRRLTVYRRHDRATALSLPPPDRPGRIAIFVAAWHEAAVIGRMLRAALARFDHSDFRIYVGTYPNDPDTIAAVSAVADPRIRLVVGDVPGPTTKAACLNRVWDALCWDELACGERYKAIVIHDAEDVVHPLELRVFDRLIERFDFAQLPVLPLLDIESPWVSAHYADEFAESHGRQLAVREALGAGIPLAGVGCAISREAIGRMSDAAAGLPFDETSLTEDYEIGLRLAHSGGRGAFVAIPAGPGQPLVAVRAYFPATFETAVRQKARWLTGIALAGWDRLRWQGGIAECWMRLRDRRAILAAALLAASYCAAILGGICILGGIRPDWPAWSVPLFHIDLALLVWRLAMRGATVARFYGWREGLRAVPRVLIANMIAIAAAARALRGYTPGAVPQWDKTAHHFPDLPTCD